MLRVSLFPFLAGASLALSTVSTLGCSSLTRPDEIQIHAEPPPPPKAAPARPAAGGPAGAPGNHAAQPQGAPSGG